MSSTHGNSRRAGRLVPGPRPRFLGVYTFALVAALGAAVLPRRAAQAEDAARVADEKPAYRVDDVTQVFVGNPRLFKKPCVVSTDRVYRAIPEYQEIVEKNLTDKDVRYHFLMRKASDKFSRAVQSLARDQGYDLVAGTGAVTATSPDSPAIPDGTDAAITRLPS